MEGCNGCTLRLSARYSVRNFSSCTGKQERGENGLVEFKLIVCLSMILRFFSYMFGSGLTFRALVLEKISSS